jgi:hypothetical protein
MKLSKHVMQILIIAISLVAAACSGGTSEENKNGAQAAGQQPGSVVTTSTAPDGTKVEEKTFADGDIASVTRLSHPDGRRRVVITSRDHRTAMVTDENVVEKAMDMTVDQIREVAASSWTVAEKAGGTVGTKAADTAETVGSKTSDAAKQGADAAKQGAGKVKEGAMKVADESYDAGKAASNKAAKAAKKAGRKIKDAVKP